MTERLPIPAETVDRRLRVTSDLYRLGRSLAAVRLDQPNRTRGRPEPHLRDYLVRAGFRPVTGAGWYERDPSGASRGPGLYARVGEPSAWLRLGATWREALKRLTQTDASDLLGEREQGEDLPGGAAEASRGQEAQAPGSS